MASESFLPGQNLETHRALSSAKRTLASAVALDSLQATRHRTSRVAIPARAGLVVCDMNTFSPGNEVHPAAPTFPAQRTCTPTVASSLDPSSVALSSGFKANCPQARLGAVA